MHDISAVSSLTKNDFRPWREIHKGENRVASRFGTGMAFIPREEDLNLLILAFKVRAGLRFDMRYSALYPA